MKILGILNITSDSFSDGGKYLEPGAAIFHARAMAESGSRHHRHWRAASSHPDARRSRPNAEIARLAAVIPALKEKGLPLSIDTFAPDVQRWRWHRESTISTTSTVSRCRALSGLGAVEREADRDARGTGTRCRGSHRSAFSRNLRPHNPLFRCGVVALSDAGIARERLILDPAWPVPGDRSRELPDRFAAAAGAEGPLRPAASGVAVAQGVLRKLVNRPPLEAGAASLAAELFAEANGADYIRTHAPRTIERRP